MATIRRAIAIPAVRRDPLAVTGLGLGTLALLLLGLLAATVFLRTWQGVFQWAAWDSKLPEFTRWWKTLFWGEIAFNALLGLAWAGWALAGCSTCRAQQRTLGRVLPWHQLRHVCVGLAQSLVITYSAAMLLGVFGEQDASWHQVAIRDTALTPSHIPLFYFWFPLVVVSAVGFSLYTRTRIEAYHRGVSPYSLKNIPISLVLTVIGTLGLMAWVAVNEYAHSQFQAEELFSATLHAGFIFFFVVAAAVASSWFELLGEGWRLLRASLAEVRPGAEAELPVGGAAN